MAYNPTLVLLSSWQFLFFNSFKTNGPAKNQAAIAPYALSCS
jgi:hypothetical protein